MRSRFIMAKGTIIAYHNVTTEASTEEGFNSLDVYKEGFPAFKDKKNADTSPDCLPSCRPVIYIFFFTY